MVSQSQRWRGIISTKIARDRTKLSKHVIHQIRMYILKCKDVNLDWRNQYKYTRETRFKGSYFIFNDSDGNIIWVRELTDDIIGIRINSTEELSLNVYTPDFDNDIRIWKSQLNYKLSMIFSNIKFGKRLPYSKSSTHMTSLMSLEHQLNRFNISLDEPEWDQILVEKLEKLGSRKYRGIIKAFDAADALYDYYLTHGHKKDLDIRYALFIRLYQESRASGSWSYYGRRIKSEDKSIISSITAWNSYRGLNWNTTITHLNNFRKYMGYKWKTPYISFDWMPANKSNLDPFKDDHRLLNLLNSFYEYRADATGLYYITKHDLIFILKRFFNKWYKSIMVVSNSYGDLESNLIELANKINNFEYSKCRVTI